MLPLVVLASEHHGVLVPDKALTNLPPDIIARAPEIESLAISMPNIESSPLLHDRVRSRECINEKLSKVSVSHFVILDG